MGLPCFSRTSRSFGRPKRPSRLARRPRVEEPGLRIRLSSPSEACPRIRPAEAFLVRRKLCRDKDLRRVGSFPHENQPSLTRGKLPCAEITFSDAGERSPARNNLRRQRERFPRPQQRPLARGKLPHPEGELPSAGITLSGTRQPSPAERNLPNQQPRFPAPR